MFLEVLFLKRQENLELKGLDLRKSENTQSPRLFANAVKLDEELLQKKSCPDPTWDGVAGGIQSMLNSKFLRR